MRVDIIQTVEVTVNKKKFTKKFMREFRESFYNFHTLDEHLAHLAQLFARGLCANNTFIEGYGQAEGMGIRFKVIDQRTEPHER